jgi:hypothetical protein
MTRLIDFRLAAVSTFGQTQSQASQGVLTTYRSRERRTIRIISLPSITLHFETPPTLFSLSIVQIRR